MNQLAAETLHWIVGVLKKHRIPFQITGGLAAIAYGATRELADIDIDFPELRFDDIIDDVREHVTFGPSHFKDEHWDLKLMTLDYRGQTIDLGGAFDAKIFDSKRRKWIACPADFATSKTMSVLGQRVPVIARGALIDYKRRLGREVDLLDIAALQPSPTDT